ncbi:MAG: hypothetical protein U0U69_16250 [Acidimicrobiia bacterium]
MPRDDTGERDRDSVLATALGTLRDDLPAVPTGLVDDILSYVFEGGIELPADRRHRLWWFVTAGIVAALVGGVATGVLVRWRRGKLAADLARLGLATRS